MVSDPMVEGLVSDPMVEGLVSDPMVGSRDAAAAGASC